MISDADYQAFLSSTAPKVLLLEIDYWDGVQVQTAYLSDRGYNTNLSSGVEHRPYVDAVRKLPSFRQTLDSSRPARGEIVIENTNGARDAWITDYKFDGRKVRALYGSPYWQYADFREVFVGVVEHRSARNAHEITLHLKDPEAYLDVPVQSSLISSGPNLGDYEPIAYGQINNAPAVLIDGATHEYQVSDLEIDDIVDVKDGYLSVAGYTKDLANGKFTLNIQPAGKITVDFRGAKVDGQFLEKAGEIIDHIITTRTALPAELYDDQAFLDLDVAITWKHNLYIDDRTTARQAINRILDSIGAKLVRNRAGQISVVRLEAPKVSADHSLHVDDLQFRSLKPIRQSAPWKAARLGYNRNYTVQAQLDTAVTEAQRAAAERAYDVVSGSNAVTTAHPLAEEPELIETTLTDQADATARLTELLALYAVERLMFEMQVFSTIYTLTVGQTVQLTHPRFGFASGKNAVAYLYDDNLVAGRSRVQLWL